MEPANDLRVAIAPRPKAMRETHKQAHRTAESEQLRLILMRRIAKHINQWPRGKAVAMIGGDEGTARRDLGAIKEWDANRDKGPRVERLLYICHRIGISGLDAVAQDRMAA